jgi:hypothetical protein
MGSRAENVLQFRRVNMHGSKDDPNYAERYHPGGSRQDEAFRRWFGNSQVVNDWGEPMVVYHGTNREVRKFNPGSHFGTARAANERIKHLNDFDHEVGRDNRSYRMYPVYLKIENPLVMPDLVSVSPKDYVTYPAGTTFIPDEDFRMLSWESIDNYDLREYLLGSGHINFDEFESVDVYDALSSRGYDGIMYQNDIEDKGSTSWIIFDSNQVKSASGNTGEFDPENPQLGFERGP